MRSWTAAGFLVLAVIANLSKAIATETQYLVWPFWSVTYRYGFVRRGLVGTLFHALGFECDDRGRAAVLAAHRVATAIFVAGVIAWTASVVARQPRRRRLAITLGVTAALLSPLLPTVGQNAGYYDVHLLILALFGAWAAAGGRFVFAGIVGAIGPFVHDAFPFLWLPVLLAVCARGVRLRGWPLLLPIASAALVQALHSKIAVTRIVEEAKFKEALEIAYRFDLAWFAERMRWLFSHHPDQVALAALLFAAPAAVTVVFAKHAGVPRRWAIPCMLAPCTILLVAWDLSRFLVWSSFGAFVALLTLARTRRSTRPRARCPAIGIPSLAALATLAFVATGGPHLYAYFHVAYADYTLGPSTVRFTPAAHLARAWLRVFNRKLYTNRFASHPDSRDCLLEPWDARRDGAACAFVVADRTRVESPLLWLPQGAYVARLTLTPSAECAADDERRVRIAARGYGRFAPPERQVTVDIERDAREVAVELPFDVDEEQEAIGRQRIVVFGERGCFRLEKLRVDPRVEEAVVGAAF